MEENILDPENGKPEVSDPTIGDDKDLEKRVRTQTEKGLEYTLDIKQKNRNTVCGRLNTKTQKIEELIEHGEELNTVLQRYSEWMFVYDQFREAHYAYNKLLPTTDQEKDNTSWFNEHNESFLLFKTRLDQWIERAELYTRHARFFDSQIKPEDSVSNASRKSGKTSRSSTCHSQTSSLSLKRMKEQQRKAELEARAVALRQQQYIQQAKLKLKEKELLLNQEEEQLKLSTEMAISDARSKVIAEQMEIMSEDDHHLQPKNYMKTSGPLQDVTVPKITTGSDGIGFLASIQPEQLLQPSAGEFFPHDKPSGNQDGLTNDQNQEIKYLCHDDGRHGNTKNESSFTGRESPNEAILTVVRELKKPQSDIKCFSGDVMEYTKFIRQFKSRVVANTGSDDERMNFLEQYTTGEANKVVSGFGYLAARNGYPAALKELEDRYGNSEVIANAYLKRAMNWPSITTNNAKALDEFAMFLTECENAVKSIEAMRILEYPDTMKRIVSKLPPYLHNKWRSIALTIRENHGSAGFSDLVRLVKLEAKKATDPLYGKEALYSERDDGGRRNIHKNTQFKRSTGSYATTWQQAQSQTDERPTGTSISKYNSNIVTAKNNTSENQHIKNAATRPCIFCESGDHSADSCERFSQEPISERLNFIKSHGFCFGCLKAGHHKRDCRRKASCTKCKRNHPTVLHDDYYSPGKYFEDKAKGIPKDKQSALSACASLIEQLPCHMGAGDGECTLAIIPVMVKAKNVAVETYAFLDSGSSVTFCRESLVKQLGLHGRPAEITLDTMGRPHTMSTYIISGLQVSDLQNRDVITLPRVYTKESIPVSLHHIPRQEDISQWPHLRDIILPEIKAEIGLLIGNNVPDAYTPLQTVTGPRGSPHASKTRLGWIPWNIVRETDKTAIQSRFAANRTEVIAIQEMEKLDQLDKMVRSSINRDFPENIIDDKRELSQEDKGFIAKVNKSIEFSDGHYQIGLPFRSEHMQLPNNQQQAMNRLKSLKRKMQKNPSFFDDYKIFMSNIISKGYAEKVPNEESDEDGGSIWYVPHHGVYHPKRPEKLRVVFDCSAKCQGISLNDLLLQGPDLTNSLVGVLLRFRQKPVAVMGDIESMFYQVRVPDKDRDYLRFYWWTGGDLDGPPDTYRMTVHLFGSISSPSCSNTALQKTATDNKDKFRPEIVNAVLRNFYVDDCLASEDNVERAVILVKDLTDICREGGFHLTKWASNSRAVIQSIPEEERAKGIRHLRLDCEDLPNERALGVGWSIDADTLGFKILLKDRLPTRRGILSIVSSVFDPLGLAAPFILPAKYLLQDLCRRSIGWDEKIGDKDLQRWRKWQSDLPLLENLAVPRCYKPEEFGDIVTSQIHNFSDASEVGYGTASYLRITNQRGQIHCSLLIAKSRVAPLKKITMPRMELTAATISVRMNKMLEKALDIKIDKSYFWTDSMSVLRYCSNQMARFHTFVANRLNIILGGSTVQQWRYVETGQNPADDASRGMTADKFLRNKRWLEGPEFLWKIEAEWPQSEEICRFIPDGDPEVKKEVNTMIADDTSIVMDKLLTHFSSWPKLKKAVAWFLVYKDKLQQWANYRRNLRKELSEVEVDPQKRDVLVEERIMKMKSQSVKDGKTATSLSLQMLQSAEKIILKYVQRHHFRAELELLKSCHSDNKKTLKRTSLLYKLDPILEDGLIRVGGRLERASLHEDMKHPIVLPKNSNISKLILEDIHRAVGHLGRGSMLSMVRSKYWILRVNAAIRRIINTCVTCRRYRSPVGEQKMANLPADHLTPEEPPFTRTGVD